MQSKNGHARDSNKPVILTKTILVMNPNNTGAAAEVKVVAFADRKEILVITHGALAINKTIIQPNNKYIPFEYFDDDKSELLKAIIAVVREYREKKKLGAPKQNTQREQETEDEENGRDTV